MIRALCPLLLPALLLGLAAAPSPGQSPALPPMPEAVDRDFVERDFDLVADIPFLDQELKYRMAVRKGWENVIDPTAVRPKESYVDPILLAAWREHPAMAGGAALDLSYLVLPFSLSPAQWLDRQCRALGIEVLARRTGDLGGRRLFDIVGRLPREGGAWIERTGAFLEGERLFLVSGRAPADRYAELAPTFAAAILSFEYCGPPPPPEPACAALAIAAPFRIDTVRPTEWGVAFAPGLPEGVAVVMLAPPESAGRGGWVRVQLVSAQAGWSEADATHACLGAAGAAGWTFGSDRVEVPVDLPETPPGKLLIAVSEDRDAEIRVFCFRAPQGWVTLAALGPAHSRNPAGWRGWRAVVEKMADSLRVAP